MTEKPDRQAETCVEEQIDQELEARPRSATLLNLKWLAQRLRRSKKIKTDLSSGRYLVDNEKLAKAILNKD